MSIKLCFVLAVSNCLLVSAARVTYPKAETPKLQKISLHNSWETVPQSQARENAPISGENQNPANHLQSMYIVQHVLPNTANLQESGNEMTENSNHKKPTIQRRTKSFLPELLKFSKFSAKRSKFGNLAAKRGWKNFIFTPVSMPQWSSRGFSGGSRGRFGSNLIGAPGYTRSGIGRTNYLINWPPDVFPLVQRM